MPKICAPVNYTSHNFWHFLTYDHNTRICHKHCLKSLRIWSYSGWYFPAFELNTEGYGA